MRTTNDERTCDTCGHVVNASEMVIRSDEDEQEIDVCLECAKFAAEMVGA